MNNICEYCKKEYSSQSALNYHKKTAKFCLSLQKTNNTKETELQFYKCNYCEKQFTNKCILTTHLSSCVNKIIHDNLEQQRQEYENKINELKKDICIITHSLKFKEEQLKEKDEQLKEKEEQLKEKDEQLKEKR